jgi:hypothetical protein
VRRWTWKDFKFTYTPVDRTHGMMSITCIPENDTFIRDLRIRCDEGAFRPVSNEDYLYVNNYELTKLDIISFIRGHQEIWKKIHDRRYPN